MRIPALLPTVFMASVTASSLLAQDPRIVRVGPGTIIGPGSSYFYSRGEARAIIGVSTTNSATSRDTLGVLVSSVRADSPADKAGIEEGNRIASINGDLAEAAIRLLDQLVTSEHEIITLIEGEGATPATTRRITEWLHDHRPDATPEVHLGGQPLYPYLFGIE